MKNKRARRDEKRYSIRRPKSASAFPFTIVGDGDDTHRMLDTIYWANYMRNWNWWKKLTVATTSDYGNITQVALTSNLSARAAATLYGENVFLFPS